MTLVSFQAPLLSIASSAPSHKTQPTKREISHKTGKKILYLISLLLNSLQKAGRDSKSRTQAPIFIRNLEKCKRYQQIMSDKDTK